MKRVTFGEFLERARAVHGDKYDYSQAKFISASHKITIVCPIHGPFVQKPLKHLIGQGCIHCGVAKRGLGKRSNTEDFIAKANKIHGEGRYDYSEVVYETAIKKVKIICPQHGPFMQVPNSHLNGNGCPECAKILNSIDKKSNTAEFVEKAKAIHGDKYDYSKVDYKFACKKVEIICAKCGNSFYQTPNDHLHGYGCPRCAGQDPKPEREISQFLTDIGIDHIRGDRRALSGLELDIYIPEHNIAVEHTGLYWHSTAIRRNDAASHLKYKFDKCLNLGIKLYTIYEDEWHYRRDIVKSMLLNSVGKSDVIYARKTEVKKIDCKEARDFLDKCHIQGATVFSVAYGLYCCGELVSVMTFTKPRKNMGRDEINNANEMELSRFCNKLNTRVVGAASKLLKAFIKDNPNIKLVYSYSDNRISNGDLYSALGFSFVNNVQPNYFYVRGSGRDLCRFRKQGFRKCCFKDSGIDVEGKTEFQLAEEAGYNRLYDAGKKCWELKLD